MIGCTKLLCGQATVSEAIKHRGQDRDIPPQLLQFSATNRPLVVWNMTNRCNLKCMHCYIKAEDRKYQDELTTEEAKAFICDLAQMKVPVLLFSGGEPLLRKDIFELGSLAADLGLRPVISTNGTLIDSATARNIKAAGFQYVGISIDGGPETHDRFRMIPGAFEMALRGMRICLDYGIKTGIRFTVNKYNQEDLPEIFDLVEKEGIPRFCMYHLVYAGRGAEMTDMDTSTEEKQAILDYVCQKTVELANKGIQTEILTTDNHADGIYLLNRIKAEDPERAAEVIQLLRCTAVVLQEPSSPMWTCAVRASPLPCRTTLSATREAFQRDLTSDDPLLIKLGKTTLCYRQMWRVPVQAPVWRMSYTCPGSER